MVVSRLKLALVAAVLACAPAHAQLIVHDKLGWAEQYAQKLELQKQLEAMLESNGISLDQLEQFTKLQTAIGDLGTLQIPTLNFTKISGQLVNAQGCLIPDLEQLMPDIRFDELDLGSVCSRANAYRSNLMVPRSKLQNKSGWQSETQINQTIRKARLNVIADASTKGLAHSDQAIQDSLETVKAAQEYKQAAQGAKTVNDRLQVISEVLIALLQSQARTNQLLAQSNKIQAAASIQMNLPIDADLALPNEGTE